MAAFSLLCKSKINHLFIFIYYEFKKKESIREQNNLVTRAMRDVEGFSSLYYRFCRSMSVMGRSQGTVAGYGSHLAAISLHFGRLPLDLSADEVQDYLYSLQQRSKTPSQTYFKHTVFGLRFLLKSEDLPYEHLRLPSIRKDSKLPVVLSKEEVWRLLGAMHLLKYRILLGLLYGCGLRCSEVCNVRLRDLDFDRKLLHVVQGKCKKDRYLPLSDHLIRGLKTYIETENPREWLFNGKPGVHSGSVSGIRYSERSVQLVVKQAVKLSGINKNAHVHTLRHSYATHLLEDGLDIITLKNLMGHSRIQTTMTYLHVAHSNPQRAFSPLDTLFAQCAPQKKK